MKLITAAALTLLITSSSYAQTQTREQALKAFADDLKALQDAYPDEPKPTLPYGGTMGHTRYGFPDPGDVADAVYENIMKQMNEMVQKWKNNQYVQIDGFSISAGLSPSVDVNFSFKPDPADAIK